MKKVISLICLITVFVFTKSLAQEKASFIKLSEIGGYITDLSKGESEASLIEIEGKWVVYCPIVYIPRIESDDEEEEKRAQQLLIDKLKDYVKRGELYTGGYRYIVLPFSQLDRMEMKVDELFDRFFQKEIYQEIERERNQ